jgi:hypothetical protein
MNVRKLVVVLVVFAVAIIMTGCSTTTGYLGHTVTTEVQLSQANFDVIGSVTGEAEANYFIGFGPSKQNIVGQAKRDMINKANLKGSQALVNVTTDVKYSWFPIFWRQQKAYVSAEIVEFK